MMQSIALFFLVALAMGGVAWVFIYPSLSGERQMEKRKESVARAGPMSTRTARHAVKSRREQVEGTLKELEQRNSKSKKVPLTVKIAQAGLTWSKRRFIITAISLAAVAFLLMYMFNGDLLSSLGLA